MKLVRNAKLNNGEGKFFDLNYYDLDTFVQYDDIESILEVLPRNYSYNGFNISETVDEGRGFSKNFYSLSQMQSFYNSHGSMDEIDTFSFNMLDCGENISFNFSIGSDSLQTFGNTVSFEINDFVSMIEENIIKNKKKQL